MKRFGLLIILLSMNSNAGVVLTKDKVICSYEAYNCPSYKGEYQSKKLSSCRDVKLVWEVCGKSDPHDLDRDSDGWPCERDCPRPRYN